MNVRILFIFAVWFVATTAFAGIPGDTTVQSPPTAKQHGLLGPVRSVRDTIIVHEAGGDRVVARSWGKWYAEYDTKGRATLIYEGEDSESIIRRLSWTDSSADMLVTVNNKTSRNHYQLDEHGRVVAWGWPETGYYRYDYNNRGQLLMIRSVRDTITCRYDDQGRLVEWFDSMLPDRRLYYHYSNNNTVRWESTCVTGDTGNCIGRWETTYDGNGLIIENRKYSRERPVKGDFATMSIIDQTLAEEIEDLKDTVWYLHLHKVFTYDSHKNETEDRLIDNGQRGEGSVRSEYIYDKYGNWIQRTKYRYGADGTWKREATYRRGITYY